MRSVMIKAGTKTLRSLIGVALALVFLVVVPFHHHADGQTHNSDCQICAVASHALIPDAGPGAPLIFVLFLIVALCGSVVVSSPKDIPHLRGPPVF